MGRSFRELTRDDRARDMEKVGANRGDGYNADHGGGWGRPHPLTGSEVDELSNAGRRVDQYKGGDSTKHGPGFPARPWGKD
jgi:hypothetical protein